MSKTNMINLEEYGFNKLSPKALEMFQNYLAKMPPGYASTMSFASLIAWRQAVPIYYIEAEGFLQVAAYDSHHKRTGWLPLIGDYENGKLKDAFEWQIEKTKEIGFRYLVTDVSRHILPYYQEMLPIKILIEKDDGDSDYIYLLNDFKESLNTQEIRYNYRYFVRKFNPIVEDLEARHLKICQDFISQSWCCNHSCNECGYGCQKDTAACIISEIVQSGAKGIVVFSEGQMVGYCIVSSENGQIIFLFKKTKRGVRGINEFLHKECIERFADNVYMVNYTEDMNIEGLKKYKQNLCKYELFPRYVLMED